MISIFIFYMVILRCERRQINPKSFDVSSETTILHRLKNRNRHRKAKFNKKHGDEYKLTIIQSDYKYAQMSYELKQKERFEKVIAEYTDFKERYPESKLLNSAKEYNDMAQKFLNNIKK